MPMLDAYIPEGALSPSAERELHAGAHPNGGPIRPHAATLARRHVRPSAREARRRAEDPAVT
jgi:hypothetical protein